jgi:hypothetical protein
MSDENHHPAEGPIVLQPEMKDVNQELPSNRGTN